MCHGVKEMEIKYVKLDLLNKVDKEQYDEELKQLMGKIKQKRKALAKQADKIDNLKSNFEIKIVTES